MASPIQVARIQCSPGERWQVRATAGKNTGIEHAAGTFALAERVARKVAREIMGPGALVFTKRSGVDQFAVYALPRNRAQRQRFQR